MSITSNRAPETALAPEPTQRLGAADRVASLTDPGTFRELGSRARHQATAFGMDRKRPEGDGVVTGIAEVDARPLAVFAQDPTALGGSLGETHAAKIVRVGEWAGRAHAPLVGLLDSGGARIQEGVAALDGYGSIFRANVALSGRVPQVSTVLGACAGGAVYSPALTDLVIMERSRAQMFLTGPRVVKAVTFEDVDGVGLGGADVHSRVSGVAHLTAEGDVAALDLTRRVLSYLPSSCWDAPPTWPATDPDPMPEVPPDPRRAYDVRGVVRGLVDSGSFLELQEGYARSIVIGFARLEGVPVGVVANQPYALAGTLDCRSAEKGARFVRMCDAFGLPLVTLVDTPGFLPGTAQEQAGVIRRGAKLLYAFAEATVPRVTVVLRKAFGGAYIVMNSKSLGADAVFAWPTAQLAVMGAEGAADIIFRREIADGPPERRDELIDEYRRTAMVPEIAAERLSVDEIIAPEQTREALSSVILPLARRAEPRFRHDNLPQ